MDIQQEQTDKRVARRSVLIYGPLSLGAGILFLLATGWTGSYPLVARLGGAVWVTLLTLIVSMPVVISRVKTQSQGKQ